ncbi:MAG: hypothetical protein IJ642_03350 [Oscillospiraceae bacterium]|nr:hypothetical protein [Oscillospiraceae bacterium]
MNKIIVSSEYGADYQICQKKVTRKGLPKIIFETRFAPQDIAPDQPALHSLWNMLKTRCSEALSFTAELQKLSEFSSFLPDYHEIREEKETLIAESTFYEGEILNTAMSVSVFFYNILSLCKAETLIIEKTGKEPGIPVSGILFESGKKGAVHFLHLDFSPFLAYSLRNTIGNCIAEKIFGKKITFTDKLNNYSNFKESVISLHPAIVRDSLALIKVILHTPVSVSDWNEALEICESICQHLKEKEPYFIHRIPLPKKQILKTDIFKIRQKIEENHVLMLQADAETARAYADTFRFLYVHTAEGDANNGLLSMLESENFSMSEEDRALVSAPERLNCLQTLCDEPVLLIIRNCHPETDSIFSEFLRLPADIIFLTEENYSDCGLSCLSLKGNYHD